jgi:hypothetical protein
VEITAARRLDQLGRFKALLEIGGFDYSRSKRRQMIDKFPQEYA